MRQISHKELKEIFKLASRRYANRHDVNVPKSLASELADALLADKDIVIVRLNRPEWEPGFKDGELINPS